MNELLMDDILMSLGGLMEKRKMRKEEEQYVDVNVASAKAYRLTWRTGNTLDISTQLEDHIQIKIATIYLTADGLVFDRNLAIMVYGIITGYDRVLQWGA